MSGVKPLAVLTAGLLARKGEARPAMRPQRVADRADDHRDLGTAGEALGWNDMGDEGRTDEGRGDEGRSDTPALPAVLTDREALAVRVAGGPKSAFTLRLDADRHLRLRLAAATRHRSAQQIVTEALDAFLATLPEVEALARSMPRNASDTLGNES